MRQATSSLQRIVKTALPFDPSLPVFPGMDLFSHGWTEAWDSMQTLKKLVVIMNKQSDNPAVQKLLTRLDTTLRFELEFWAAQVHQVKMAMNDATGMLQQSIANIQRYRKNYSRDLLEAGLSPRAVAALGERWEGISSR